MKKLLALAILCTLVACGSDEGEKKKQAVVEPPPPPAQPTIDQALDAGIRAHPHALKICYDSRSEGFIVFYKHMDSMDPDAGNFMHDWYYIKVDGYYPLSNGSWYVTNQPDDKYVRIYPDDTNMPCKAQATQ